VRPATVIHGSSECSACRAGKDNRKGPARLGPASALLALTAGAREQGAEDKSWELGFRNAFWQHARWSLW